MELHVYYTKEFPRRHAVTLDQSGENLAEIEPPGVWFYWKTVTRLPGVSGYDAVSARADKRGTNFMRENTQSARDVVPS